MSENQNFYFIWSCKNKFTSRHSMLYKSNDIRPSKKMFGFSDNGFQKKGKVGRVFIFCFHFQSNMGKVFIFCFYFQRFENITQTSSILLFWRTNDTIMFTLSTGRIVHGTICLEHNCTLNRLAYPYNFGVRLSYALTIVVNFLTIRQICGISRKFSVPVRHFIAVPYIIDRICISDY